MEPDGWELLFRTVSFSKEVCCERSPVWRGERGITMVAGAISVIPRWVKSKIAVDRQ